MMTRLHFHVASAVPALPVFKKKKQGDKLSEKVRSLMDLEFDTPRSKARALTIEDWEACAETVLGTPQHSPLANGDVLVMGCSNEAEFKAMLDRRREWSLRDQSHVLGLFLKSNNRFIGDALLFHVTRSVVQAAEIGLYLYKPYQGAGFGQECLRGILQWGFSNQLNLNEIRGHVEYENVSSMKSCLRAGFQLRMTLPVTRQFGDGVRKSWPIVARADELSSQVKP